MKHPAMPVVWEERLDRRLVQGLVSQFNSVAEAVKELVDNAVDRAEKQTVDLSITLNRAKALIIVESDGGQGMGAQEIADWLAWGSNNHAGRDHDIGFYGQGGKAACAFLASDVVLWTKKMNRPEIWHLVDENWATRTTTKNFGEAVPSKKDRAPASVRNARLSRGHVRIELRRAHLDKRWNIDTLKRHLSSTYSRRMHEGKLKISVDGDSLLPLRIPVDTSMEKVQIDVHVGDIRLRGWAGKLDRVSAADAQFRSGFRLFTNGRLIQDAEWFGYNWQGKGALNLLVGELTAEGLTPNLNKTAYTQRSEQVWDEISTAVISQISGLIAKLRIDKDDVRVTRSEQARAIAVRQELSAVIKSLYVGPPKSKQPQKERAGLRQSPTSNTEKKVAPPRIKGLTNRQTFPLIEVRAWEHGQRAFIEEGKIVVNKAFPAYLEYEGSKAYIAETAISVLVSKDPEVKTPEQFIEKTDGLFSIWLENSAVVA